jgi:phage/plasmid-associated DNA primase
VPRMLAFKNLTEVYKLYQTHCQENNVHVLTKKYFYQRIKEKNLSIYELKKDQCNVYCSYNKGSLLEAKYIHCT